MDIRLNANPLNTQTPTANPSSFRPSDSTISIKHLPEAGPAYIVNLSNEPIVAQDQMGLIDKRSTSSDKIEKAQKPDECQTCKNRTYQDSSDDAGVSFKAPGHISPETSASTVRSHEQEHIRIAQGEAQRDENKEILRQSIRMFTAVCPECGKTYVSGGEANTTMITRTKPKNTPEENNPLGQNIDIAA